VKRAEASPARRLFQVLPQLLGLLAAGIGAGVVVGTGSLDALQALEAFLGLAGRDPSVAGVVFGLRLPRSLLAALAGGALSLSGLILQAVVRNPLADPYLLGVSGGAALGAVGGIVLGAASLQAVGPPAFLGALAAFAASAALSVRGGRLSASSLVLSGVMLNALCSAAILFVFTVARDNALHSALAWLAGDTSGAEAADLPPLACAVLPCAAAACLCSHRMNLLLLGAEQARSLGLRVNATRVLLVLLAALMTAAAVSRTGLLGFVGLVCPHILRRVLGHDQRVLVPCAFLFGAVFLVSCDLGARALSWNGVMPVGVLTALVGAPAFLALMRRSGP